ncbi:YbaB/EbfC family nucleoid-associated protein [Amycolatopsis thermophila]|uniref:DNA-binding protein YbaB n=1 Tax=Amycolatopsis thermophila TaxID=206084 RepID=A0ABU0EVP7_9PSEU|nr:YbaB/EbfC family nucleoid-associated protein [Amycolatopsis thermophila]MDQ0379333.1 DNA-binding protein YbaB [Amycolatopsis thermophila]
MADLPDIERMVDDWERNAVERSQRFQAMQHEVEQISITESVAGGAVSVTVGNNGIPTDVRMTDAVRTMSPDEIAANVLKAMQKAQSKYPQVIQEIVAGTVGESDSAAQHIVRTAAENFPEPPAEDPEPPAPGRQLRIETEADDEPPQQPRRPPQRPRRDDDDGDFGDQSFLRRD